MPNAPYSLDQASIDTFWKIVIYGGTGVGKTVLSCGSQKRRTFVFDVDRGIQSAASFPGIKRDLIHAWPIASREDFAQAFQWLVQHHQHYQLAVVDTASELQNLVLGEQLNRSKHIVPERPDYHVILSMMED